MEQVNQYCRTRNIKKPKQLWEHHLTLEIVDTDGNVLQGKGCAKSKQEAKEQAARQLMYRIQYAADCYIAKYSVDFD